MTASSGETDRDRIEVLFEKLTGKIDSIKTEVDSIKVEVDSIKIEVDSIKVEVDSIKQETARTNDRVETYQKASQQVVNLAFGLILTSSLAIIVPAILGR